MSILPKIFQFAPRIFLEQSLAYIDKLPHEIFDEFVEKYADMNTFLSELMCYIPITYFQFYWATLI